MPLWIILTNSHWCPIISSSFTSDSPSSVLPFYILWTPRNTQTKLQRKRKIFVDTSFFLGRKFVDTSLRHWMYFKVAKRVKLQTLSLEFNPLKPTTGLISPDDTSPYTSALRYGVIYLVTIRKYRHFIWGVVLKLDTWVSVFQLCIKKKKKRQKHFFFFF